MTKEQRLAEVFVELADTMVDEFDVIDMLHLLAERTVSLLDVDAAGLMLADQRGQLAVLAATSHEVRLLEILELQNSEGPCLDCFTSGEPVVNIELDEVRSRWPSFEAATSAAGYRSVHALPLRLRSNTIGAMNLFCARQMTLSATDLSLGQALADVATIGLLHERAVRRQEVVAEQLQTALNSRIVIEQAKGILAERSGVDVNDAFTLLRSYSRRKRRPLSQVAAAVITGEIPSQELHPVEQPPGDG